MRKIFLLPLLAFVLPAYGDPLMNVQYVHRWEYTPKTMQQLRAERAARERQEEAWQQEAGRQAQAQAQAEAQAKSRREAEKKQAKALKEMQDRIDTLEAITYSRLR